MFILAPKTDEKSYEVAANIFKEYYKNITGITLKIKEEASDTEDMVVIGSEAVQPFVYKNVSGGLPIRCNSDDYCLISKEDNGRNLLFLAGGRGRSTIYAVYDFFERQAGCHYFWDGDVIPEKDSIDINGLNVTESPRFTYRAIRYFAHRGLGRFQAEHWDFDEWKKEIDWICKSRLNVFMLRIGIDDLFQKAFPDIVSYPSNEEVLPEATEGFNNRTTFWSLEYRGQLQKRVMDYAFSCDLIHPEDCGTMTHWYSRTPIDFLNSVKPTFLSQTSKAQSEQTGLVWDILDEKNLRNYKKLTDTHIKEYGKPEMFHTIGLAERTYGEDRRASLELKKYAYRKIIDYVSQNYPNAPMLIASWDFFFCLKPDEIREITSLFNPENTLILDYTVDLKAKENNDFENWDIVGKMPWVFGIFHAYEPQNHIHGDYEYINKKLEVANNDPLCKGMAFWPELSHSDTLMLEYFKENSWKPQNRSINEIATQMCHNRYGNNAQTMLEIWNYGFNYVEHAREDFKEMIDHGCDTVILAITEFDMDFWFPNINEIVKTAHEMGLRVLADTWGIGKYFGGEQVSLFLQNNIHHRQVSAYTGEVLNAACFNTNSFRDYFKRLCMKLARETEVDGFFWDEPHYAYPKAYASITGGAGDDWACRCPECMKKFEEYYGYEMPKFMNDDVKQFRWREALYTLEDTSKALKEFNPDLEITCCVHATLNTYYVTELRGYDNWEMVAACPYFDVFSTTIINWELPESFFRDITERTVAMAKKYGKQSERWLMGYNKRPADFKQIDKVVDMYEELGVDRLATWTYRGGYGTVVAAKDPIELWDNIGRNYKRVLKK